MANNYYFNSKKWLNDGEGLRDRGITRDLTWGIPVKKGEDPWPGLEGKVFYVWFDAPIEYIAATAEWEKSNGKEAGIWETWWRMDKGAKDVKYFQFMAKDNIPFHTLSFPATLMGSNEPWKLVDYIKGFNWLLYEGEQVFDFPRSRCIYGSSSETITFRLLAMVVTVKCTRISDSDFTWESFQACINKDLSDVLGNFVSRVTKFSVSKFGNQVPSFINYSERQKLVVDEISEKLSLLSKNLENIEIRKACLELRNIWSIGNEYLQSAEPWKIYKEFPTEAGSIINFSFNLINLYSTISQPFIPETCSKIINDLKLPKQAIGLQIWV